MTDDRNSSYDSSSNYQPPKSPDSGLIADAFGQNEGRGKFRLSLAAKIGILAFVVAVSALGYYASHLKPTPVLAVTPPSSDYDPDEIADRKTIPDIILTDDKGGTKKLSDYKGNVVILSFWASWCTPCLVELPTFAEIQKKFNDRGLRVLAVNVDDGDENMKSARDFWAKKAFPFPGFYDANKNLAQTFEVEMLPSNFVIDRKGRLVFSGFGATDWSSPQTSDLIENLLNEKDEPDGK